MIVKPGLIECIYMVQPTVSVYAWLLVDIPKFNHLFIAVFQVRGNACMQENCTSLFLLFTSDNASCKRLGLAMAFDISAT